ncbi:MAG: TonB-dependent receptor [Paludibacteraceae bacterium]|nr:TonB-dependent receptor [Paludibacteraceae bacterium]
MAQTVSVSGKVTDSENKALPGVNISVEGTTTGTISGSDGTYNLAVPADKILVFTFTGMLTQRIPVKGKSVINVVMIDNNQELNEVVVIGYGSKVKGALTGSIAKVGEKSFQSKPITSTLDALQGVIPGVTITRSSGQPGQNFSMQIRGNSSINGNKPMVLVDGVPGNIDVLNPNDIADITILKDAAASIYGARAADGVMLITTKKGQKGKPMVSYSMNYGFKQPQYLKKMASTIHTAEMYDEGLRNVGEPGLSQVVFDRINTGHEPDPNAGWMKYLENYPGFYGNTDWYKVVYGNSSQQMHNLSVSGGGDNNNYLVSVGYNNNKGTFNYGVNYADRYNLRLNYDFKILDKIKFETRTTFDNAITVEPSMLSTALYALSRTWNYLPIYNPKGQYYKYQGYQNAPSLLSEGGNSKSDYSKFITNFKAEIDIIDGLKLVGQSSIDLSFWRKSSVYKKFDAYKWDGSIESVYNDPNSAVYENSYNVYKSYTSYLDYNKKIGNHQLNALVGVAHEEYDEEYQSVSGKNFSTNQLFTLNLADKTKLEYTTGFNGSMSDNAMNSYFGRFSYGFSNKYFLDVTMRKDGSSKFAPSKRWSALYPAVSAAWNITNESFMKTQHVFNNLKLRTSWGQSGNQEINFGNYDYIPLLYISGSYPLGNPNTGLQGAESGIASADRSWETIETANCGIDISLLDSKLSGSFDYFVKSNDNMLVSISVPAVFGGTPPTGNYGKLRTSGWEFSLKWADKIGDFKYAISANISDSKNKLIDLQGTDSYYEGINWARQGYSLYTIFGYQFDGIIKDQAQLDAYKKLSGIPSNIGIGDAMYKDLDGDGKITAFGNAADGTKGDMKELGNKMPRYTYSSSIDLSYKGFDLGIMFQGVGAKKTIRNGDFAQPFYWVWHQPLEYFYGKSWTPENTDAQYPRLIMGGIGYDNLRDWNWKTSSMRIVDVSYLRIKQITLGYNIPDEICGKVKMSSIRLYFSGKDLFTISKGTWGGSFDPEEDRSDWLSETTYPFNKVFSFGIDVKF